MPEGLAVLLDQNIPRAIARWLRDRRPAWSVLHANDADLAGEPDEVVFADAQVRGAVIVTFDEDFADQRTFPVGSHAGIVRLRIWPTTVEETEAALERLLATTTDDELRGALVIVDRQRIRVRRARTGGG